MAHGPYSQLIATKRWADRGLHEAVAQNFARLSSEEVTANSPSHDTMTGCPSHAA